jgi:hypothetical protein
MEFLYLSDLLNPDGHGAGWFTELPARLLFREKLPGRYWGKSTQPENS